MGLFSGNSSIERAIETATDGKKTTEDWVEIQEILDQIDLQQNGPNEAVNALIKRVKHRDPHVNVLALVLLDAFVANAKRKFLVEISSSFFVEEVRGIFKDSHKHNRDLLERFARLIKQWSEQEFKSDPVLASIPALWLHIRAAHPDFAEQVENSCGILDSSGHREFCLLENTSSTNGTPSRKQHVIQGTSLRADVLVGGAVPLLYEFTPGTLWDEVTDKAAEAATTVLLRVRRVFDDCTLAVWGVDKEGHCPAAVISGRISEELKSFYEATEEVFEIGVLTPNQPLAVLIKGRWYRAQWLSETTPDHSVVYLVDHGEGHTVPSSDIRLLAEHFGKDATLAMKVTLFGLPVKKDALLRDDIRAILTAPGCEALTATVISPSPVAIVEFNLGKRALSLPLLLLKRTLERRARGGKSGSLLIGENAGQIYLVEIDKQDQLKDLLDKINDETVDCPPSGLVKKGTSESDAVRFEGFSYRGFVINIHSASEIEVDLADYSSVITATRNKLRKLSGRLQNADLPSELSKLADISPADHQEEEAGRREEDKLVGRCSANGVGEAGPAAEKSSPTAVAKEVARKRVTADCSTGTGDVPGRANAAAVPSNDKQTPAMDPAASPAGIPQRVMPRFVRSRKRQAQPDGATKVDGNKRSFDDREKIPVQDAALKKRSHGNAQLDEALPDAKQVISNMQPQRKRVKAVLLGDGTDRRRRRCAGRKRRELELERTTTLSSDEDLTPRFRPVYRRCVGLQAASLLGKKMARLSFDESSGGGGGGACSSAAPDLSENEMFVFSIRLEPRGGGATTVRRIPSVGRRDAVTTTTSAASQKRGQSSSEKPMVLKRFLKSLSDERLAGPWPPQPPQEVGRPRAARRNLSEGDTVAVASAADYGKKAAVAAPVDSDDDSAKRHNTDSEPEQRKRKGSVHAPTAAAITTRRHVSSEGDTAAVFKAPDTPSGVDVVVTVDEKLEEKSQNIPPALLGDSEELVKRQNTDSEPESRKRKGSLHPPGEVVAGVGGVPGAPEQRTDDR